MRKMSINGNKCDKMHCMRKMSILRVYFCIHWTMKIPTKLSTFLYTAIHNACRFRLLPSKNAPNFQQKTAEFIKKQLNFSKKAPNSGKKSGIFNKKTSRFYKKATENFDFFSKISMKYEFFV